jgi:glycosyltransferase (TIGR04182 family)
MLDPEAVTVLLPTYDEAATIGDCVDGFHAEGFDDVLVMDGGSTDDTRAIAHDHGARVEVQTGSGKGQAIREAVDRYITREYVLMADGDGTYLPEEAHRMLEPLDEGYEHVIGDRFADMEEGAMTRLNQVGNRITNRLFGYIHGEEFVDILSGYRAFTRRSFQKLTLTADGFGVETEMAVECAKRNVKTTVVPITYLERPDGSNTNLHPIKDGGIIFLELYRRAKTNNPLFYFGSVGTASTFVGVVLTSYVVFEWVVNNTPHEIIAVGAAGGILFGVQLLMFGVLSDLILTLHRDQMKHVEEIASKVVADEIEDPYEPREADTDQVEEFADADD